MMVYLLAIHHSYGKSPCSMGKLTNLITMFNGYVELPEGIFLQILIITSGYGSHELTSLDVLGPEAHVARMPAILVKPRCME